MAKKSNKIYTLPERLNPEVIRQPSSAMIGDVRPTFAQFDDAHVKNKIIRSKLSGDTMETDQIVQRLYALLKEKK